MKITEGRVQVSASDVANFPAWQGHAWLTGRRCAPANRVDGASGRTNGTLTQPGGLALCRTEGAMSSAPRRRLTGERYP